MSWNERNKRDLMRCPAKVWAGFLLAAVVLATIPAGVLSSSVNVHEPVDAPLPVSSGSTGRAGGNPEPFPFEEPGSDDPAPAEPFPDECGVMTGTDEKPRIAIIIDDMGYHRQTGNALLDLDLNLTYAFLPYGPFTPDLEQRAWNRGRDILVHMPMEARDPAWDPGPGALYLADPPEARARLVAENLLRVPHAIGSNNHMGSRFTEDREAMDQFLSLLARRGLFFVDSITSSKSVGVESARAMGIRTAGRQVFLDNVQTREDICRQLRLLVKKAFARGWAIGIGHPNEATLTALTRCRSDLLDRVRVVGVRELVR